MRPRRSARRPAGSPRCRPGPGRRRSRWCPSTRCGASRRVGSMVWTRMRGEAASSRFSFRPSAAITMSATSPLMTTSASNTTVPIFVPAASSVESVASRGSSEASSANSASVVPSSGVGTSALPSSSSTTAASASSPPAPPRSSGTTKRGGSDLLAQQLPQRLVVATLRRHRLAHRGSAKHASRPARQTVSRSRSRSSLTSASRSRRRCSAGSPQAERSACTRNSHNDMSCSWVNPMAPCVCRAERAASSAASAAATLAALTSRAVSGESSASDSAAP